MAPLPIASAESLLAHQDFVRGLARRLLADEHAAEDLAQDTWVKALHRPPAVAGRAWLSTVVRNLWRNRRRDEAVRVRREQESARADWVVPTASVIEREHARREVVDAVLALDEPYRSTILLRFFEDLSAAEIARRSGTNAATVRSRLARALDQLRGRLDAQHGGDRHAWTVALFPLAYRLVPASAVVAAVTALAMKTKLLIVGSIFAALVTWFTFGQGEPDAVPSAHPERGAATSQQLAGTGAAVADVPLSDDLATPAARVAATVDPVASMQRVLVVSPDGHTPAAGAEVLLCTGQRPVFAVDTVGGLAAAEGPEGKQLRASADGTVDVPAVTEEDSSYPVFARLDGLFGTAVVARGRETTIRLETDRRFDVRVVDAQGVAIPAIEVLLGKPDDQGELAAYQMRVRADREGLAHFDHVQTFIPEPRYRKGLAVGLNVPLKTHVQVAVDLETLPSEPIVLTVPGHGSLGVTLVDANDAVFTRRDEFAMDVELAVYLGESVVRTMHDFARESMIRFEAVEPGAHLRLSITCESARGVAEFDGPKSAGGHVDVRLRMIANPMIHGRLLDDHGELLRDFQFCVTHFGAAVGFRRQWGTTDTEARFELPVPDLFDNPMVGRRAEFTTTDERRAGLVVLDPISDSEGSRDVGDIRLGELPALAHGVVVDPLGTPIGGVHVLTQESDGKYLWGAHSVGQVATDAAGEFTLRGWFASSTPRLSFSKTGFLGHIQDFRGDPLNLHVTLRGAGVVVAHVNPGAIDPASLVVTLDEESSRTGRTIDLPSLGKDGAIQFKDVEAGLARVTLRAVGVVEPLHQWNDIEVRAGETVVLPPADLSASTHRITLTVVDGQGAPLPRAVAWTDPLRVRDDSWAASRAIGGHIVLTVPRVPVDVAVSAPGCRQVELRGVSGDRRVELEPGFAVTVELDGPAWPAEVGMELRLEPAESVPRQTGHPFYWSPAADPFVVATGDGTWHAIDTATVQAPGRYTLHASREGRYVARLRAMIRMEEVDWSTSSVLEAGAEGASARIAWDEHALDALARSPSSGR